MAQNSEERVVEIIVNGQKANASMKEMTSAAAVLSSQVNKIAADDPKRAELIVQLQEMRQRLAATRQEVAGLVQSQEQLAAAQAATVAEQQQAIATGKLGTASFSEMKVAAGLLEKQLHELSADDPGRAVLIADYQQLKQRMSEARQEIELVAKSEAQLRQEEEALQQAQVAQQQELQRTIATGKLSTASFSEMKAAAGLLEKQLHELSADDPGRAALIADYQRLKQRMGEARQEIEVTAKSEAQLRQEQDALRASQVQLVVNGQKVSASMREMREATVQLEKELDELAHDDPARGPLIKSLQEMKSRLKDVQQQVVGVSQTTGVMKQAFANAFAIFTGGGIIGVVQQVWGFLKDSKEEFMQSAKSSADLDATLKSTAHSAGLTGDEIRKIGEERAKVTLFDDDETNRASAMLLTFTNIKKGVFEDAIPAIQDLATKMGGDGPADMKGASIQVGKALNDPIAGIKALTRVGVTFTDQQKEQIAAMVKAGNTAGAQKLILAELNKEFGGSAEAARKAGGGMATLSMRWNEMKETVGGFVSEGLTKLSQWLGRVLDNSQPIVDIFVELGGEVVSLWHDVSDLVDGLGLFGEKGDSAVSVANFLKGAITLLAAPLRLGAQLMHALIDGFIQLYNKSEMLRGVLGGLGAMIVSVFTTIKDDALKILGGVGDILIGIFTLDKNKIAAGFKSALSATADLALESGQKAADAFLKGYEANKNNHITRSVRVETTESTSGTGSVPTGGDDEPAGESAKAKAAREAAERKAQALRDKAAKARIDALKELVKQEEALEDAHILTIADQREREIARINLDAKRKAALVVGTEQEMTDQRVAINDERERKLQELSAKYQDAADKKKKEDFERQIADEDAAEQEREAKFLENFEKGLETQKQYDQFIYDAKYASLQAKLALEEAYAGKTSKLYLATNKELLALEKDHNKQVIADTDKREKAKREMQLLGVKTAGDVLQTTIDILFQDEAARKKHHNLYTALSGAKIIMDGVQEVASIWRYSAENPLNGVTGGVAGAVIGGVQTALAVARTVYGLTRLQEFSFAKGGRTGSGMMMGNGEAQGGGMAVSPMGTLMEMSGMAIGSNGKLMDNSGFAVAGLVHEDEYVVPKWMRQDPQVVAVEQWLEAKRLRGYAEGGGTGGATLPAAAAAPQSEGELTYAVLVQLLEQAKQQTAQLADVKDWQARLVVYLNLADLEAGQAERKQVQLENGIRK